jgi:hypothetical protein
MTFSLGVIMSVRMMRRFAISRKAATNPGEGVRSATRWRAIELDQRCAQRFYARRTSRRSHISGELAAMVRRSKPNFDIQPARYIRLRIGASTPLQSIATPLFPPAGMVTLTALKSSGAPVTPGSLAAAAIVRMIAAGDCVVYAVKAAPIRPMLMR